MAPRWISSFGLHQNPLVPSIFRRVIESAWQILRMQDERVPGPTRTRGGRGGLQGRYLPVAGKLKERTRVLEHDTARVREKGGRFSGVPEVLHLREGHGENAIDIGFHGFGRKNFQLSGVILNEF